MARTIRFHLDEHVSRALAEGLRRRGIDVTTSLEAGLCAATDEDQLAYARLENRVFITRDSDFLRLHARRVEHGGIIFCNPRRRRPGNLLEEILVLAKNLSDEDWANHVEFV